MALYTAAEIKARIGALLLKIEKAETAQSYGAGVQVTLTRGDLRAMYHELERLEKLYRQVEVQESGAGTTAYVQFEEAP